jgi:hypothetical protein
MGHFQPIDFRQNPNTALPFGIYLPLCHHHVMPLFQSLGLLVHYQLPWNVTLFPSFLLAKFLLLLYIVFTGSRQGRVQKKGEHKTMNSKNAYCNGYLCQCSKIGTINGINITWENNTVIGYDCNYPDCSKDCQLLQEFPIGFKHTYPNHSY